MMKLLEQISMLALNEYMCAMFCKDIRRQFCIPLTVFWGNMEYAP